jgi:hypothetical protein
LLTLGSPRKIGPLQSNFSFSGGCHAVPPSSAFFSLPVRGSYQLLVLGQSSRATLGNQPNGLSIEPHQGLRDVNGDGKPDLMVANYCAIKSNFAHGVMGVLLGNGAGTFLLAHRASI